MELVGDRFVRLAPDDWRDLATGARVRVEVGPLPPAWRERLRQLTDAIAYTGSSIVDGGRLGVSMWFEAYRLEVPHGPPGGVESSHEGSDTAARAMCGCAARLARAARLAVSTTTARQTTVVARVDRGWPPEVLAGAIGERLRHDGVVAVRAGPFADSAILRMLERRHVVVLAWTGADRRALARWTGSGRLTRRPRAVIDLRPRASAGTRARSSGGPVARVSVSSIPEVQLMSLSELLSPVLEIIHEAEDEAAALSAVARWLRRTAGADAVAFVGTGAERPLASVNWTERANECCADERGADERGARGDEVSGHARVADDHGVTRVDAPIRYGGIVIGALKAVGPAARRSDLARAVEAAAALCAPAVRARLDAGRLVSGGHAAMPEILGASPAIAALRESIARAAATPFAVLLDGESGTGKELAARAIHRLSVRRDRRFCAVNSAALTDELFEAELFGHARGAFTGAIGPRTGLFEEANGGTLFLDEAGELTPRAQAKLLRAIQEGEIRRVGENTPRRVNVRIVAATNRSLADMVARGTFREDLLFRLAVIRIRLPPLRERVEDIQILALASWKRLSEDAGIRARLATDALARLSRHAWPGNVRQLQNVMAGLVMIAPRRGNVTARHVDQILGAARQSADDGVPLDAARRLWERRMVARALARHGGRRAAAARELGLTRQGLVKAIKRLGLGARVQDRHAGVA